MLLTPNDVGILVEHTVWRRGKVIEILSPYAIIHFPSLASSPQGPQRKLREDAPQLTKSSVQSDPELDGDRDRARQAEEDLEAQGQGPAERPRRSRAVVREDLSGEVRGREVRRQRPAQQARGAGSVRRPTSARAAARRWSTKASTPRSPARSTASSAPPTSCRRSK